MVSLTSTMSDKAYSAEVDQVTEAEWNNLLSQFADASIYQTWAYGAVSWGEKNLSHLLLKQGGRVVGMAQFRLVRVPVLGCGIAYLRWGPLHRLRGSAEDCGAVLPALLQAIANEYASRRRLMVRVVPNAFHGQAAGSAIEDACAARGFKPNPSFAPYRTVWVDLAGSPELIRKRLDQKWRNQLNASERNDLQVREGTSDEVFAEFAAIYRELLARKQFETTVDIDEFARLQRRLPENLKMQVLLCEKEGKIMAGMVASGLGDTGVYLLGATSAEGMKSKGSYLLQWHMMQRLRERGCISYDLGGINPERNPGVYHFKSGFGGQEVMQCSSLELRGSSWSNFVVGAAEKTSSLLHRPGADLVRMLRKPARTPSRIGPQPQIQASASPLRREQDPNLSVR